MAQKRRKEQLMKRRERRLTALCIGGGIGAMLLSLFVCMMIFDIRPDETPVSAPATTALPYDSTQPFSAGDLTSAQMNDLRSNGQAAYPSATAHAASASAIHSIRCSPATRALTPIPKPRAT